MIRLHLSSNSGSEAIAMYILKKKLSKRAFQILKKEKKTIMYFNTSVILSIISIDINYVKLCKGSHKLCDIE